MAERVAHIPGNTGLDSEMKEPCGKTSFARRLTDWRPESSFAQLVTEVTDAALARLSPKTQPRLIPA